MTLIQLPLAFQQQPGGMLNTLVLFGLIFAIFYFLVLAPARKRQKALQEMIDNLGRGDKVITSGGLHGEVAAIDKGTVILKIAENVKVRVSRNAIAELAAEPAKGSKK